MWILVIFITIQGQVTETQRVFPDKESCQQRVILINNTFDPNIIVSGCTEAK